MKPHEHLFLLRHIAMGRGGIEKVSLYLEDYLPAMFTHPSRTMEDCDMFSFLHGVLQVYLEYCNSSSPFEEYKLDFSKPSQCVQDKWAHMVTEIIFLLNHIRSCQYLPNINTVEIMEDLQKLNMHLITILDQYFNMNIWMPDASDN